MAKGYTGCIDIERLNNSITTLSSISDCVKQVDLTTNFLDFESYLKDANLEHGNFSTNHKNSLELIMDELENVKKELDKLTTSLKTTVNSFSSPENLGKDEISKISDLYGDTTASINIKELLNKDYNIKISDNISLFQTNVDDSIKGFMIKNNFNDYPKEFSSLDEWQTSLEEKYANMNIPEEEKLDLINQDMSVWRQEQTGSLVAKSASSSFAEQQTNIADLRDRYMFKYNLSREDATNLANLKEEYNSIKNSANYQPSTLEDIANNINKIEKRVGINLSEIKPGSMATAATDNNITTIPTPTSNDNITTIPVPTYPPEEAPVQTEPINTVPIGLGIAATGISGAVGAVLVDSYNDKKKEPTIEDYKDPEEEFDLDLEPEEETRDLSYPPQLEPDPTPYYASRNNSALQAKFYDEELPSYYREEE